jgi:class 3 adenylate cyclase/tetratricopeptide (TPR) repeat protein/regulation of enolase protein 1 (concanavalin A-like superfamily)
MECGAKLDNICPKCGAKLPSEAKFCMECGTNLVGSGFKPDPATVVAVPKLEDMHTQLQSLIPDALAQKYLTAEQQATGENRPITALFADISGFTPLSATKSSETIFQMVQDCFKQLVSVVAKYEGSISGFRGDGLLALFGAPILHENDAERAILSAIDMRNAMQDHQLQVSIGINTAMMTVGEIQTQLHSEYTAYGTDINLAKRLQESAEPGQILVGSGTHRLTRRIFDFDVTPNLTLKGFSQSVTAYSVKQVKAHPEKLRGIEGLRARMIGREHEFADAKESVDEWLNGHGQMLSIIGEAGIGKSRLVSELKSYLANKHTPNPSNTPLHPSQEGNNPLNPPLLRGNSNSPFEKGGWGDLKNLILEGRCVSIGQPISYWPFIDILKTYFNLSEGDDTAAIARKVTESIAELMPQGADETLPLLGQLLSIKYGNELDDRLKFATPEQIRHQTLMRLRDVFETLAKRQPLLLILEDLHWSDDLSIDLISLLMDELVNTPIMLLCVYRPEHDHRVWQLSNQARRKCMDRFTEIILNPLSSIESRELIESLLEIENLPEPTKKMIMDKSEGNPFFIEEVIRSLIEQGMIYQQDDRWIARDEIANIDVPDTIQSVILSRVDRLQSEAKYILQCASVIGRLFKHRLLDHLTHQERELNRYISEFEDRELIYEERTVPELEYAFKHALTQEATYQSILERKRKEFHSQVAIGIESLYQERLEDYYDELAQHYSKSDDVEKAIEYLLKAGEKAKRSYANESAITHFHKALELLEGQGIDRKDWKLEALRGLGETYLGIGKMVEAEKAFEEAIKLAKEVGLSPRQLVRLCYCIGEVLWWQSRYDEAIHYCEMGLEILEDDTECLEAALINAGIAAISSAKGNREKWEECHRKDMAFIKALPYSVGSSHPYLGIIVVVAWVDRDLESAWEWSKELEKRAGEHHDLSALAQIWLWQGHILKARGDHKGCLSSYQKSLGMLGRIGDNKHESWCHSNIGTLLLNLGNIEEAGKHGRLFLTMAERVGYLRDIAWAHVDLGTIAMCQRYWDEAIFHYQKNLEGRQAIRNPSEVASAHLHLGRAYLKKGDYTKTLQCFEEIANLAIETQQEDSRVKTLVADLCGLEVTYRALEPCRGGAFVPAQFVEFCRVFKDLHADALEEFSLRQWYLESAEPSKEFSQLAFADNFETQTIDPSWQWIDEFEDCSYNVRPNGLEICAANGRDFDGLNLSAPRLMRDITGDFVVEVCVSPSSHPQSPTDEDKPHQGGLLVWKDRDNFLRFDKGIQGQDEMRLHGYVNNNYKIAGRGLLPASENEETHLRLERSGDEFSAYCNIDGENWLTCGKMTLPMEDPIQIGIHAIGMIDRTIYCGEYKEGTATLFRNFRIWKE